MPVAEVSSAPRSRHWYLRTASDHTIAEAEVSARFVRDVEVVAWALEAATGVYEVCGEPAPFTDLAGMPFPEIHHVRWLSHGPDTCDNAVAACPNCHRALHLPHDCDALRRRVVRKIPRLGAYPKVAIVKSGLDRDKCSRVEHFVTLDLAMAPKICRIALVLRQ
ncbi:HNH endonuclease [Phenylobacterium sp. Root700]|uniref:HNH endonuclease n=1 Tax=Phenylobacterium sp. Root700 TaxID=1736591 RepID=UPI001F233646|nr:HNH endonuclease [Phenylobacterium sp. Root700]